MNRGAAARPGRRGRVIAVAGAVIGVAVIAAAVLLTRSRTGEREVFVEGRTVDGNGAPLADVQISLEITPEDSEGELPVEHVSTRSDARGRFSIRSRVPWPDPSYTMEASKDGFETVTIEDADEMANPVTLRLASSRP